MTKILSAWWRSMGMWRWMNLSIVIYACYLALNYEAVPDRWVNHGRQNLAGFDIRFFTRGRIVPGEQLVSKFEASEQTLLRVGFKSFESTFITIQPETDEINFSLAIPKVTTEPLELIVFDQCMNAASWNLGRLY